MNPLTYDTQKAKEYFENKIAFSVGPVEVSKMIKKNKEVLIVNVRASFS